MLNWPGEGPPIRNPIRLPSASNPPSDNAISVPASGWPFDISLGTKTNASSPLLYGSLRTAGGVGNTSPRARVPPLEKSKRMIWLTRSRPT